MRSRPAPIGRRALLLACAGGLLRQPSARAGAELRVEVLFHVTEEGAVAVAPQAFLEAQLADANLVLAESFGFGFRARGFRPLAHAPARLTTRAQRSALATSLVSGVVNVFVVAQLMDVDEPGRERRGVHWKLPGRARSHYVILSKIAGPYVLAHELCHFFGNPAHSDLPDNLLNYQRGEGVPRVDARQIARARRALSRMRESGELE